MPQISEIHGIRGCSSQVRTQFIIATPVRPPYNAAQTSGYSICHYRLANSSVPMRLRPYWERAEWGKFVERATSGRFNAAPRIGDQLKPVFQRIAPHDLLSTRMP